MNPNFYALIPAGGSGTRLWPISRSHYPKFLHSFTSDGRTLAQSTVDRLGPLVSADRVMVVTGVAHAVALARQLPQVEQANLLVEPMPRGSAAAIGLATAIALRHNPEAIMGVFSADHIVQDLPLFQEAIATAIDTAEQGYLVTVGITPTRPETGYGYIQLGDALPGAQAYSVKEFTEKPPKEAAEKYVKSGNYLWNASMFVWKCSVLMSEIWRQQPDLAQGLTTIAAAWDTPEIDAVMAEVWPGLLNTSIDYAVMEDAAAQGLVATVPGRFSWCDVGDWEAVAGLFPVDTHDNCVIEISGRQQNQEFVSPVVTIDCQQTAVLSESGRHIAALGLSNIIIVDTDDALLVCARDKAQDVKKIVDSMKQFEHPGLT